MTEPKRRGRPPKAKPEIVALPVREMLDIESGIDTFDRAPYVSPKPCPECGQAVGHYDDCSIGLGVAAHARDVIAATEIACFGTSSQREAQAYANRVWHGQSHDAPRAWRVERVRLALEGQGLPFEGVVLP